MLDLDRAPPRGARASRAPDLAERQAEEVRAGERRERLLDPGALDERLPSTSTRASAKAGEVSTQATTAAGTPTSSERVREAAREREPRAAAAHPHGAAERRAERQHPRVEPGCEQRLVRAHRAPPLRHQLLGQPVDVAGAEGEHHVALAARSASSAAASRQSGQ